MTDLTPEDRSTHATPEMSPLRQALADIWLDLDDGGYSEQRLSVLLKEAGCDDDAMDKLEQGITKALTAAGKIIVDRNELEEITDLLAIGVSSGAVKRLRAMTKDTGS